jgi:hypothetical protein
MKKKIKSLAENYASTILTLSLQGKKKSRELYDCGNSVEPRKMEKYLKKTKIS